MKTDFSRECSSPEISYEVAQTFGGVKVRGRRERRAKPATAQVEIGTKGYKIGIGKYVHKRPFF